MMATSADSGLSWGPPTPPPTTPRPGRPARGPARRPRRGPVRRFRRRHGAFSSDNGGPPGTPPCRSPPDRPTSSRGPHLAAANCRDQPRRHGLRRLAGQPLRTRRYRQRHRPQHLGQRHHLVAGHPHPARPGRQQRRPLHPRPRRNRASAGRPHAARADLLLRHQSACCGGSTCQIQAEFASSLDNGQTWSAPQILSDPMQLGWLAPTTQGVMVGDYISTSFLAGQQRVVGAFAIGFPHHPTACSTSRCSRAWRRSAVA